MEQTQKKEKGLLKAASWIAFVILLSKIFGFLRDVVVANFYGASMVSDAYFYAYQLPALAVVILGGVGGPFHSATVAVFSKLIKDFDKKPEKEVKKLFNTFETFSLLVFGALSLFCFFFPHVVMGIIINGASPELIQMASNQLRVMSPIIFVGAVIGIYYGILVTHKHFLLPNISPSFMSVGLVLVLLITGSDATGFNLALGTMIGAFAQLLAQMPLIFKMGYTYKPSFDFFNNKNFKEITELLFPAFLSSTVGQLGLYIDMFFASGLKEGAWTSLGYANRIFQFPTGMILAAVLVPLFPLFSKLVGQKDFESASNYFAKGVTSLFYVATYMMIAIFILRYDAIKIALERGAFDSSATFMVSEILFIITLSIIPYVFRDSATRFLYAFNDSKTPFFVAGFSIILKFVLNTLLVKHFGIYGICTSTAFITLFNAVLLGYFASRKTKIDYKTIFKTLFKILIAGFVAYCAGAYVKSVLSSSFEWSLIFGLSEIVIVGLTLLVVYVLASYLLKISCFNDLVEKFINKKKNQIDEVQ
ncbi:MAG: murein biosynthesis integral membrane protein MurJ [Cyanobacteria bacterium SIG30]|nr:murein biosynthesis integral membrane protein MurJ [Cyanobacteria bacterium SIG30]